MNASDETILELNEGDKRSLSQIDAAFKGDSYDVLVAHNERLYHAARNWCQNASEYCEEAKAARLEAKRARRGLLFASVICAAGWLLFFGTLVYFLR